MKSRPSAPPTNRGKPQGNFGGRKRAPPPWYEEGASVLAGLEEGKATLKSLVHSNLVSADNKRKIFALVCQYLKYRTVIEEIRAKVLPKNSTSSSPRENYLLSLMLYDLLFGRGIQCGGPLKALLQAHKPQLKAELAAVKAQSNASTNEDLLPENVRNPVIIPRFARVNTLRLKPHEAIAIFQEQGFILKTDHVGQKVPGEKEFWQDEHLPEILLFAPNTDFHLNDLYLEGKIVLQDKASCFPAVVLGPPVNSVVIDACAAPGNKTSHLAALMKNTGKIFAFDISSRRLDLLKKLTGNVGAKNIEAVNSSFLDTDPHGDEYKDVEYVLLDPSCSGSGIVGRFDELVDQIQNKPAGKALTPEEEEKAAKERLRSLAEFQLSALQHAFQFPKVKRVVYSTCSIHREENEDVVAAALNSNPQFELIKALPTWHRRGLPLIPGANNLVRTVPKEDHLIGFFVASFQRRGTMAEQPAMEEMLPEPEKKAVKAPLKRKLPEEEEAEEKPAKKEGPPSKRKHVSEEKKVVIVPAKVEPESAADPEAKKKTRKNKNQRAKAKERMQKKKANLGEN